MKSYIGIFFQQRPAAPVLRTLQLRPNERHDVSNHQRLDCLPNRLFMRTSKRTSKLRVTGVCEGNPPVTIGFPSQRASNAENVSIWWPHREWVYVVDIPVFFNAASLATKWPCNFASVNGVTLKRMDVFEWYQAKESNTEKREPCEKLVGYTQASTVLHRGFVVYSQVTYFAFIHFRYVTWRIAAATNGICWKGTGRWILFRVCRIPPNWPNCSSAKLSTFGNW